MRSLRAKRNEPIRHPVYLGAGIVKETYIVIYVIEGELSRQQVARAHRLRDIDPGHVGRVVRCCGLEGKLRVCAA